MKKSDYLFQVRNATSYKILRLTVIAGAASLALVLLLTIAILAKLTEVNVLHATIGAFILAWPAVLWLSLVWLVTDVADCAIMIAWQGRPGCRRGSSQRQSEPNGIAAPKRRLKRPAPQQPTVWTVACPACLAESTTDTDPSGQECECPACGCEFDVDGSIGANGQ